MNLKQHDNPIRSLDQLINALFMLLLPADRLVHGLELVECLDPEVAGHPGLGHEVERDAGVLEDDGEAVLGGERAEPGEGDERGCGVRGGGCGGSGVVGPVGL